MRAVLADMAQIGRRLVDLGSNLGSHAELLARGRPALEALRALDGAVVAPPEAAALVEAFAERFHATPSAGDHLRLPPPPFANIPGPEIRAAVQRVITASAAPIDAPAEVLEKEAALRRMLIAYRGAFEHILSRTRGDTSPDTRATAGDSF